MPTNEQRRATAKRKLERQLERRAAKAKRQRLLTIGGAALGVIVLVGAIVWSVVWFTKDDETTASADPSAPAGASVDCAYPAAGDAAKPATAPKTADGKVPTDPPQVSVSVETTQGNIGLMLDNAKAPCTVNSFISLASQKYFDDTPCHRLTNAPGLGVLQCGDPSGSGTGGPGYSFADEYPSTQYPPGDPAAEKPMLYPRGTLAMANSGPATNGSQFFLVYKDSQLPPNYTMFGTIDETGLQTLDKIAAGGITPGPNGPDDGKPKLDVKLKTVQQD
ncbi:peptidylprolyl isomerase [Mycolicibacterium arenosum]|uniref:Peptidyl-prolyl cis-trans isomerase n=1 Tax=Mycolicibacterium arenosum TaxID=2952157 RepID=A0ABT1M151_9MYCO|nr:peptidylprolyl isomerase [Mycolicibacterium sp. CAU 1645]MCP9272883.1 peptidylprolyl isomerase [Mycolicibacterium sp. CAU 1645]